MYVVCNEHLEDAIEEFVEVYEQSPDIYELEKVSFTDWASPHSCNFCEKMPKYLVTFYLHQSYILFKTSSF
jgi:CxxH/CxxC protein (TIGR04129 family)